MSPLVWRRRERAAAETFSRALAAPGLVCPCPDVQRQVAAARALAPAVHPREEAQARHWAQIMRTLDSPTAPEPDVDGGSHDGPAEMTLRVARVQGSPLGYVDMVDLEQISEERAQHVTRLLEQAVEADRCGRRQ